MRINGINTTYFQGITFGHNLNEEKSKQKQKLSDLNSDISSLESQKRLENSDYNTQDASLDSQISQLENDIRSLNSRISTLRGKIDGKGSAVDSERSRGYQYSQTITNNNNTIKNLQETQKKSIKMLSSKMKKPVNELLKNFMKKLQG